MELLIAIRHCVPIRSHRGGMSRRAGREGAGGARVWSAAVIRNAVLQAIEQRVIVVVHGAIDHCKKFQFWA